MVDGGPKKNDGDADGDSRALDATFHTIERLGLRFARRWLANPEDRKEVVQDAAAAIWERMKTEPNWIVPGQPLGTLVYNYIRNKAADRLRADYADGARLAEYERRELNRGRVQLDSALQFEAAEAYEIMERALMKLPPAPREVWRAIEERGLTLEQVAAERGVSANTIRAQYYHANCAVQPALEKYAGGGQ
jgi:RNA polymerase sigma factor (sigma-70 family)